MIPFIIIIIVLLISGGLTSIINIVVEEKVISKILVNYDHLITTFSSSFNVPKRNIYAIIAVESGGNPDLPTGLAGEVGLMQITKPALDDVNRIYGTPFTMEDLKLPYNNILIGTAFYRRCYNYYIGLSGASASWEHGKTPTELAFRAYNAGFTGVERGGSMTYLNKINKWLKLIAEMGI